jgi:hypothetical protein
MAALLGNDMPAIERELGTFQEFCSQKKLL